MVINAEKTKIMIITTRQKWQYLDKNDINICNYFYPSRETNSMWSKVRDYLGFKWIISSPGIPIYNRHTTRLPENSHLCAGQQNTFHIKQGKRPTTAASYHISWNTAAHFEAMLTYQSAFSNYEDLLPEQKQTLNTGLQEIHCHKN